LQYRSATGQLHEGHITPDEVVDEVIVNALSQNDRKSELLSVESWFHRLALQAICNLMIANSDTGNVSLGASVGRQNVSGSDENALQYHQPDDKLQEESVIPDSSIATPEEIIAGEEMVAQLDLVLRGVSILDREAFVLHTLEGFTVDEIARLANRPAEQVRSSIHLARAQIQRRLPAQNDLKKKLLGRRGIA